MVKGSVGLDVNEGHAESLLEPSQCLAHGRVAHPEALARRAKPLRLRHRDEGRDPVEFIGHWAEYLPALTQLASRSTDSFARAVAFAISQPNDVDINEILFRPTRQEL